ncbi:MAG: hypothetical protein AAF675_22050 [Pseudomonadota bacterium]
MIWLKTLSLALPALCLVAILVSLALDSKRRANARAYALTEPTAKGSCG